MIIIRIFMQMSMIRRNNIILKRFKVECEVIQAKGDKNG